MCSRERPWLRPGFLKRREQGGRLVAAQIPAQTAPGHSDLLPGLPGRLVFLHRILMLFSRPDEMVGRSRLCFIRSSLHSLHSHPYFTPSPPPPPPHSHPYLYPTPTPTSLPPLPHPIPTPTSPPLHLYPSPPHLYPTPPHPCGGNQADPPPELYLDGDVQF